MRERLTKYSNTESKLSGHPTPLIQRLVPRVNDIGEEVKREPELSGMAWCRRFAHP